MLLAHQDTQVTGSKTILSFRTEGGGQWERWDRFIAIEGKKAFHIGNICGTCAFFFERLEGANQSVDPGTVRDELNAGLKVLTEETISRLKPIIPDGRYTVLLSEIRGTLTAPGLKTDYFAHEQIDLYGLDGFSGLPHYPRTEYYRLDAKCMTEGREFYEFLVPTFPHGWLKAERLETYKSALASGAKPTAIALSVLDVKGPACLEGGATSEHWCLTHYLIDGHHKTYAAALAGKPFTLLSFLAVDQGIASKEQHSELLGLMGIKQS